MTLTPSLNCKHLEPHFQLQFSSIEPIVRVAIELGELLPGAEAQVQSLLLSNTATERDRVLVELLQDAIAMGYVRRVRKRDCERSLV